MKIRSLGYQTDLIFPTFDGEIIDRGDYLAIRTPSNPSYYWGNILLFSKPPEEGDFDRWCDLFTKEIGSPPLTTHKVFGWDSVHGEAGLVAPFLEAGFQLNRSEVLSLKSLTPPRRPSDLVTVRPLQRDSEWDQALNNQVICRDPEHEEATYRTFRERQMARYRKMMEANLGDWYGAFIDRRLVADLGIFYREGLGRYQTVQTHPDFRRRGIAGKMVFEAARQAKEKFNLHTLVIIAEGESAAAKLYRSVGFNHVEQQVGLEWWEGMQRSED